MSLMAALCVRIVSTRLFLAAVFLSGTLHACSHYSELEVTVPKRMQALSGSCLQIPCNFTNSSKQQFHGTKNTIGIWLGKGSSFPSDVVSDSSKPVNRYPMKFTGILRKKNCTSLFSNLTTEYDHKYYFRVMDGRYKATALCDPLQITIKDSPWKPKIKVPADLKEEKSVTITCSAPTPCPQSPPKLTWNLQQAPTSHIEENKDRTLTTKIQKNITLSDSDDGFNITCSASYPVDGGKRVKTASRIVTLDVKYGPKNTSASISPGSGLVSAGNWVNLTCSSKAKPPISSFTWFKIYKHGDVKVSGGDFYSFNVTADTEGGSFYCVAANELGNQTSPVVFLTVESKGSSEERFPWEAAVGGVFGVILFVCLVIVVSKLNGKRRKRVANSTEQLSQPQTGKELTDQEPVRKNEENEETIHYGEIDFSKHKPETSSARTPKQETVYAEVKASQPANSSTQTPELQEALYAQVK